MSTSSQSYPMSGGDDKHSYIHNSSYQKAGIDGVQEKKAKKNSLVPLEFQVYFNDLPNNDFNTLFRTQPPSSGQEYFSVGVPGSFYGRVLPRNSIHIGNTSFTTHWLSKVPEEVCDKKSPAWNKNYIHCNDLIEEVTEAYKVQFTKDMRVFLKARAEELVAGGLMIALGQCLPDGVAMYETWPGIVKDTIGDCLQDMVTLGLTTEEKIEMFNLPVYFPQSSELKGAIEQNRSFTIEMMEIVSHPLEAMQLSNNFVTSMYRAILSTVIEEHFGDSVVDELFRRFAKKLSKHPIDFEKCKKQMVYHIVLKRK